MRRFPEASGSGTGAGASQTEMRTVPILLRTSLPGASIPLTPYLVPVTWRRTHLSTLVNRVLKLDSGDSSATIPFDFIVVDNNELLRNVSLGEYLQQSGKDTETTLEIEYIRSTLPPKFESQIPQDDWVSAVDASRNGSVGSLPPLAPVHFRRTDSLCAFAPTASS